MQEAMAADRETGPFSPRPKGNGPHRNYLNPGSADAAI